MTPPKAPLELDLSRHCIETAVRTAYERTIRDHFKRPSEREDLEAAIDLLVEALETLEFAALRARHPALAGHTDHRVALHRDARGHLAILIDGQPLPDPPLR